MRVWPLLVFVMLVNLSIPVVNWMGIFTVHTSNFPQYGAPNIIAGNVGCSTGGGSATCNPGNGLPGGSGLLTVLTFGDFLLGLQIFEQFVIGVMLPYIFLVGWGVPPVLAAVFNGLMWFVYAVAIIQIISGRVIED